MRFPIQIFPYGTKIDFISKRWIAFIFTLGMVIGSLGLLATKGLNYGIDFKGGVLMEVHFGEAPDLAKLRSSLSTEEFGEISLQEIGGKQDIMIRILADEEADQAAVAEKVKEGVKSAFSGEVDYRKVEYVGPKVGQELIRAGFFAMIGSFAAMAAYIWFRFEWQFALGGIIALIHDAIATLGFYSLTGFSFDLTSVAVVLTIIGYSINDSVVIYDRIREDLRKYKKMPIAELLNKSLNETLSRTILTVSTTMLATLALLFFGGETIRGFSAAMAWGLIIGTYSSIYVSAPILIYLKLRPETPEAEPAQA